MLILDTQLATRARWGRAASQWPIKHFHCVPRENVENMDTRPIIVVGAGPVGMRVALELLKRNKSVPIVVFGDEPWRPYNRTRLSSLLAGEMDWASAFSELEIPHGANVNQNFNCAIVDIDREKKTVTDTQGAIHAYSSLILATGSRAHRPNIPGIDLSGVFNFRDLNDAQKLLARRVRTRHTVVIGGGLLGLEAARGMQRSNTEVTVIEHSARLMCRQLDDGAAERLREHVMALGLKTILCDSVATIGGDGAVESVELRSGRKLTCDTVVVATGIVPNTELALRAKISVGRGIRVNDNMQTSDPSVYAVGECAEHRGIVYGLVAPGFEQAAVAAHRILVGPATYRGSIAATRLKVVGRPVFSMGDVEDDHPTRNVQTVEYERSSLASYRKLYLRRNRLVGIVALGDWDQIGRLQDAVSRRRKIWPWQLRRFRRCGDLWPQEQQDAISHWPAGVVVCNCTGVTRGALSAAIESGCNSISSVISTTGASTVCGSCRPLVAELVGDRTRMEVTPEQIVIRNVSFTVLMSMLVLSAIPDAYFPNSVQSQIRWDWFWTDSLAKQFTGYSILLFSALGLTMSLRKRIKKFRVGDMSRWLVFHALMSLAIVTATFFHTGFRPGSNLNAVLVLDFFGLLVLGAVAGLFVAFQPRLSPAVGKKWRSRLVWAHVLAFWPFPILIGFHVASAYYF